jgi:hypothetical protein
MGGGYSGDWIACSHCGIVRPTRVLEDGRCQDKSWCEHAGAVRILERHARQNSEPTPKPGRARTK